MTPHGEIAREMETALRKLGATEAEIAAIAMADAAVRYKAFQEYGAKSDLLGIVGSYGDTMDDEWVLENLRRWNGD